MGILITDQLTQLSTESEVLNEVAKNPGIIRKYLQDLTPSLLGFLVQLMIAVIILLVGSRMIKMLVKMVRRFLERGKVEAGVVSFLSSFVKYALYFVLAMIILAHFGVTDFSIYKQVKQWPIVLVLVRLWKQTGYGTVVYLAAIAGIGKDLYEAASIDGASVWQKIRYITLPSLKPTIMIMVLLALGNVFRGDFGMFYQLVGSNQLLLNSSDILDTYIYRMLTTSPNVGLTAAAGLYQSILCFVTILTANWIVKKIDPEYTLF